MPFAKDLEFIASVMGEKLPNFGTVFKMEMKEKDGCLGKDLAGKCLTFYLQKEKFVENCEKLEKINEYCQKFAKNLCFLTKTVL